MHIVHDTSSDLTSAPFGSFALSLLPTSSGGRLIGFLYRDHSGYFQLSELSELVDAGLLSREFDGRTSFKLDLDEDKFSQAKAFVASFYGRVGSHIYLRVGEPSPLGEWALMECFKWPSGYDRQALGLRTLECLECEEAPRSSEIPAPESSAPTKKKKNLNLMPGTAGTNESACKIRCHAGKNKEINSQAGDYWESALELTSGGSTRSGRTFYASDQFMADVLNLKHRQRAQQLREELEAKGILLPPWPGLTLVHLNRRGTHFGLLTHDEWVARQGITTCIKRKTMGRN